MASTDDGSGGGLLNNPALYMGLGLLAQRGAGSSFGGGLLQGLGAYQQSRAAQQQYQAQQLALKQELMQYQQNQAINGLILGKLQGAQGGAANLSGASPPPVPASPGAAFPQASPGIPAPNPQAAPAPPPAAAAGPDMSMFTPPTWAQIHSQDVGVLPPGIGMLKAIQAGKDPIEAGKAEEAEQYRQMQQHYAPALSELDGILKGDTPISALQAKGNEPVMALWRQGMQQMNMDPDAPGAFNATNVRSALALQRNKLSSALQLPDLSPTLPLQNVTQGAGQYQKDPRTGKLAMIDQPRMYPTDAGYLPPGAAQGHLPASESPAVVSAREAAKNPAVIGRSTVEKYTNPNSPLVPIGTALSHMSLAREAATALGNGDVKAMNAVANAAGIQLSSDPKVAYQQIKTFAAGEISKAVLPGGGGESERKEIAEGLSGNLSSATLQKSFDRYEKLLAGKIPQLRAAYTAGQGENVAPFNSILSPEVQALDQKYNSAKPSSSAPPPVPSAPQAKPANAKSGLSDAELLKKWGAQ